MESDRFDALTTRLAQRRTRRQGIGLFAALGLGGAVIGDAAARKKNKKKIKRNDFGCVNVGKTCKNNGQCCSGICKGNKDKKKCKAHDQSTCQAGQDTCLGVATPCVSATGVSGVCFTTTGKASFCSTEAACTSCTRDKDCEPLFGAGAACLVCADCLANNPQGTACGGANADPI